jgi:hypothetical protein
MTQHLKDYAQKTQALIKSANALLDTIDAYHSEGLVLMAYHPRVHAVADAIRAMEGEDVNQ